MKNDYSDKCYRTQKVEDYRFIDGFILGVCSTVLVIGLGLQLLGVI